MYTNAMELINTCKRIQHAISKQATKYYLNGALMEVIDNKCTMVATDGHRMAIVPLEVTEPTPMRAIIPANIIKEIAKIKLKDKDALASIALDGGAMTISINGLTMGFTCIDGTFPDYNRVVPAPLVERLPIKVAISAAYLADLKSYGDAITMEIDPMDTTRPLKITVSDKEGELYVLMPMRVR